MTHPLIEAVARVLWETWRTSPIVTDAAKDVTWEDLGRWAETNIKMRTVRDTVYAEARAAVLTTLRGLRDTTAPSQAIHKAWSAAAEEPPGSLRSTRAAVTTYTDVVITEVGGPDA